MTSSSRAGNTRLVPTRINHQCSARECAHKEVYVLEARCSNCSWDGEIAITVGHEASGTRSTAVCPQCECRRILNGNFIGREPGLADRPTPEAGRC